MGDACLMRAQAAEQAEPEDAPADPGVERPEIIKSNIFDTIDRHTAALRAYKKIIKVSALDHEVKGDIAVKITALAREWMLLANSLTR